MVSEVSISIIRAVDLSKYFTLSIKLWPVSSLLCAVNMHDALKIIYYQAYKGRLLLSLFTWCLINQGENHVHLNLSRD